MAKPQYRDAPGTQYLRTIAIGTVLLAGTAALTLYDYDPAPDHSIYATHNSSGNGSSDQPFAPHPVSHPTYSIDFAPTSQSDIVPNSLNGTTTAAADDSQPAPDSLTVGSDRLTATMPETQHIDPSNTLEKGLDVKTWKVAIPPVPPQIKMPKRDLYARQLDVGTASSEEQPPELSEAAAEAKRRARRQVLHRLASPIPIPSVPVIH